MLQLVLLAGYWGTVISFRQFSRSSISLCERVENIVAEVTLGAGSCLVSGDSGGITDMTEKKSLLLLGR